LRKSDFSNVEAVSTPEAARKCGVHYTTIRRWILHGKLPAYETPGGHLRILKEDLSEFLSSRKLSRSHRDGDVLRVLVVDDEDAFRESAVEYFGERCGGFKAIGAHDGFMAGRLISEFRPDVVVLDLLMPGMNGFDVCRHIKSSTRLKHIQVLVLTAFATDENIKHALDCGADRCLAKPIGLDELKKEVRALVTTKSRSRSLSRAVIDG